MSTSFNGINDLGFVITEEEFKKLLNLINEDFYEEDLQELSCEFGFDYLYVTNATFCNIINVKETISFGNVINNFEDEFVYIMYLRKDNLLKKYNNFEEIIEEIKDSLLYNFNITLDDIKKEFGEDFIKNHLGLLNGYYVC